MPDTLFGSDAIEAPTWSVKDLSSRQGDLLERAFPAEIWVKGEIRELPPPGDQRRSREHLYFNLVEPGPPGSRSSAMLPVVLFSANRKRVNAALRATGNRVSVMDNGVEARIRGRLKWWAPQGRLQLQMTAIDPDYTLGRLAADRERVLQNLRSDGLVDANSTTPWHSVPTKIGVVTSVGSAAHADVWNIFNRSRLAHLVTDFDARTQGPDATATIPLAIKAAVAAGAEVVLLVRGGGAKVELSCFDHEAVARAVALCPVPVVTGIGHDIDLSVADQVAHTSLPTPTAAAIHIATSVRNSVQRSERLWFDINNVAFRQLDRTHRDFVHQRRHFAERAKSNLAVRSQRLELAAQKLHSAPLRLDPPIRQLGHAATALSRSARRELASQTVQLDRAARHLLVHPQRSVEGLHRRIIELDRRVQALDPALALARGWAIAYDQSGNVIRSIEDTPRGSTIQVRVATGTISARVEATSQDPPINLPNGGLSTP